MNDWWDGLQFINQVLYGAAFVFSLLFLWQLIAVLIGMGGEDMGVEGDVDADFDADVDAGDFDADADFDAGAEEFDVTDAAQSTAAFRVLSLRSILAFCTLFTWAGALYLNHGTALGWSLIYAVAWGLAAMVIVAALLTFMKRMAETGTMNVATSLGTRATVYYDIPADGQGEVRATVSGTLTHLKARVAGGDTVKAGTPVRIARILGPGVVEVTIDTSEAPEPLGEAPKGEGQ